MTNEHHAPNRVSDEAIADLHARLSRRRRFAALLGGQPPAGVDLDWLDTLVARWTDGFDWRTQEDRILALPWELVDAPHPLRVIHQKAEPDAPVVLLLHGWPDSVLRFEKVLPLLRHVTVVAPALPGYPFSVDAPAEGMSANEMADVVAAGMHRLGYTRFVVSGGDIGCNVAEALMRNHPSMVAAAHLTDVSQRHLAGGIPDDLSPTERDYVDRWNRWQTTEAAYSLEHATKPATIAAALTDSPTGLLAWIGEKLWTWTDHGDDITSVFSHDEVLTWVSAYWFTSAIGSSFGPYALRTAPPNTKIPGRIPVVLSIFPDDLVNAPRDFAERLFDLEAFEEHPVGGHFPSWEQPEAYVRDLDRAIAAALD